MGRWTDFFRNILGTGRASRNDGKVTSLSRYRPKRTTHPDLVETGQRQSGTRCSRCRQIVRKLTFYVDESGKPAGFCKACESHAKRRDLLPL